MIRTLTLFSLAAFLAVPAAEARPARAAAKPALSAAIKAQETAQRDFNARMSRLDALMGGPTTTQVRSRSAEAGR